MAFFRSGGIRIALVMLAVVAACAVVGVVAIYVLLIRDLPDFHSLDDYRPPVVSEVFDRKGRLIGEFYTQQRRLVAIENIPRHVQYAFVAAEDGSFFEHKGIDFSSIIRAAIANLREGGIAQGASTITQQMVKSLLLTPERTYKRKMREIILSWQIEQQLSKKEILYLYLNQIYFGNAAWGIGQAARSYFGKEAPELTISEAALLAGLPQRPSSYDPNRNPDAAEARRRYVLGRMLADGYVDELTYQIELDLPPEIKHHADRDNLRVSAYFTEEVRRRLFERLDSEVVLNEGLRIETTLDVDLQRAALEATQKGLRDHDHRRGYRGPTREIDEADIQAELVKLAEINADDFLVTEIPVDPEFDLVQGSDVEPLDAGDPDVEEAENVDLGLDPENESDERDGEPGEEDPSIVFLRELPFDEPVYGIVLEVDRKAETARIGFGEGVSGLARLDDVEWARKPNLKVRPHTVSKISSIFSVGDVAQFIRLPASR